MSDYTANKAKTRSDLTSPTEFEDPTKPASNQEKIDLQPSSTPSVGTANASNQVQVAVNNKDTTQVKNPLERYQVKVLPAVSNPDSGMDRSTKRMAAGKISKTSL